MRINIGPDVSKEGKYWWWCPKHRNRKGLHACYKDEDHGKPFQLRKREDIEASVGTTSNDEPNAIRKLVLCRSMKTDLLTMGMLTED